MTKDKKTNDTGDLKAFLEKTRADAVADREKRENPPETKENQSKKGLGLGRILAVGGFLRAAGRYTTGVRSSLQGAWDKYCVPAYHRTRLIRWPVKSANYLGKKSWGAYKWADNKFSFNQDDEGNRDRDYIKSTAVAAASLLIAFTGVTQVLPAGYNYTGGVAVDGIHLAIGHQEIENPYLFDPQPVEGAENVYRAKLCFDSACQQSTYVNYKPNNALNIYSRFTNGFKPYRPVQEIEPITTSGSVCDSIQLYGIQMKGMDWYQNVKVQANCRPLALVGATPQ